MLHSVHLQRQVPTPKSTLGGVAAWLPGRQRSTHIGSATAAVTWRHLTFLDVAILIYTWTRYSPGSPSSESVWEASPISNQSCLQPFSCFEAWNLLQTEEGVFLYYLSLFPLKNVNTLGFQWSEESWNLFLSVSLQWDEKVCLDYRNLSWAKLCLLC